MIEGMPVSPGGRVIRGVEGSPSGIIARGEEMLDIAEMMADSAATLEVVRDSGLEGQRGKAVRALRSSVGLYPLELQLAAEAYRDVATVLVAYGDELDQVQPRIDREVEDCEDRWLAYSVLPGSRSGNTDPDVAGVGPGDLVLEVGDNIRHQNGGLPRQYQELRDQTVLVVVVSQEVGLVAHVTRELREGLDDAGHVRDGVRR